MANRIGVWISRLSFERRLTLLFYGLRQISHGKCDSVLMGEDDLADTVKPRLEAAGGCLNGSKIIALTGVANKDQAGEYERTVTFAAILQFWRSAITASRRLLLRAFIIHPISAFMGKTHSHVNAEVRETLAPLAQLAEQYAVAMIAITHLRKGEPSGAASGNGQHRIRGRLPQRLGNRQG